MPPGYSWLNPKLEARKSEKHGNGVFAKAALKRGERLVIFGGHVMPIDIEKTLPEKIAGRLLQIEERFVIGNLTGDENADFFNHNCDPNAGFKGQIFLVAMRDIKKGEEITFDYAMVLSESVGSDVKLEFSCDCGSDTCRGKITEDDWKKPEIRKRYKGYFSQYLREKIECPKTD